jgi:hypothetical protein
MHLRNVFLLIFNLLSFNQFLTSSAEYVSETNILKASIINGASEGLGRPFRSLNNRFYFNFVRLKNSS